MQRGAHTALFIFVNAPRRGAGAQFTSSTAERSPFPSRGKDKAPAKVGETCNVERGTFKLRRAKRCHAAGPRAGAPIHERRRGEAHRRQGWVGGVYPSAPITARTAASGGHCASTRAARSAGLRFAVIPLSQAADRETTNSGARVGTSSTAERSPFPSIGATATRS